MTMTIPSSKLYVTDITDSVFCSRLLYLKKKTDAPRKETWAMLRGTNEHEVRRLLAESMKFEYKLCKDTSKLAAIDYKSCINGAIENGLNLGRSVSPKIFLGLVQADAKCWKFMREFASPGSLFWNVGA